MTTPPTNIITNDFDALKRRINDEIQGHRIDLALAALRSVVDDVTWAAQEAKAPELHRMLMAQSEDSNQTSGEVTPQGEIK